MTAAANSSQWVGNTPVGNFYVPDTVRTHVLGSIIEFVDPFFGGGEAIFVSFPASTALAVGTSVVWDTNYSATAVPNTANLGQPVALVLNAVPSVASVQYGWAVIAGKFPAWSGASVAANAAIGITAAGKLGAVSAGKQILNAKVQAAATTTVAKANTVTQSGSNVIRVTNSDGWFVGVPVSGTGIAASSTITSIDSSGTIVTLNNAATASGAVTVTATYNDAGTNFWNVLHIDRAFAQGQIT